MADEEAPPATKKGDQLYNKYKDKTFSPPDPSKYTTNEKMTDTEKERIKKNWRNTINLEKNIKMMSMNIVVMLYKNLKKATLILKV